MKDAPKKGDQRFVEQQGPGNGEGARHDHFPDGGRAPREEVKRRYWEKWNEENKDAIREYNARIASEGLPLSRYRSFGRGLGDGRNKG